MLFKQHLGKTQATPEEDRCTCHPSLAQPLQPGSEFLFIASVFFSSVFHFPLVFCFLKQKCGQKTTLESSLQKVDTPLNPAESTSEHLEPLDRFPSSLNCCRFKICALTDHAALYKRLEKREETQSTPTEAKKPQRSTVSLRRYGLCKQPLL